MRVRLLLILVLSGFLVSPASAGDDGPVIEEVLGILKERGIVDEAKHAELMARNRSYEERHESLLGKIEFSGDLRARLEGFWFDRDPLDVNRNNRFRARYRLRLNGKSKINDYINARFRLATGNGNNNRGTNQTLGSGNDFTPDGIFVHRAYLELFPLKAFEGGWVEDSSLAVYAGKAPNPFLWDIGKDYLLWDHDINPEGVGIVYARQFTEWVEVFANAGYFVIDENSVRADPHVMGVQLGGHYRPEGSLEFGARFSWYSWRSLDDDFLMRSAASGTIIDGLTGDVSLMGNDGADDGIQAGELAAYVKCNCSEDWPILLYGHYAKNFDGRASVLVPGADEEDFAWGVGLEVGDKRKYVKLGVGYYVVQANAWPAQFTDSDLFDGFTNRQGYTLYGSRQILPGTDLGVTLFVSDEIDNDFGLFGASVPNSERIRLQADLNVKF